MCSLLGRKITGGTVRCVGSHAGRAKPTDEDGDPPWAYRTTNRLNREELLGALVVQVDVLRKELRDEWDDEDDEE